MEFKSRIIGIISLAVLVITGISTVLVLNFQSKLVLRNNSMELGLMSRIIIRSIEQDMIRGETGNVQNTLQSIGNYPEIMGLRIVSPGGYILNSKNSSEIGYKSQDFVSSYETAGRPAIVDNSMLLYTPIYNEPRCFGCHSSRVKINGLVEIKSDLARTKENILAMRRALVFANILTAVFISLLLGLLLSNRIVKPAKALLKTLKRVEDGDMDARAEPDSGGELGILAESFNRMADRIKELHEKNLNKEMKINKARMELEHQRTLEELNSRLEFKVKEVETANHAILSLSRELKSKNVELGKMIGRLKRIGELGRALSHSIELQEILRLVIRTASELLNADNGFIFLEKTGSQKLRFQYRKATGVENADSSMDLDRRHYKEMLAEGANVFSKKATVSGSAEISVIGAPFRIKERPAGGMVLEKTEGTFSEDELQLLASLSDQAVIAIENAWLYELERANYFGTIQALVNVIEATDKYTRGHSERVKTIALMIGRRLGIPKKEQELLEYAAILHDIGKVGVDAMIVNKNGRLTRAELSLLKAHPVIGNEILGPIGTMDGIRTTILQHHEKYNGTGYPYGISGNDITLKARILSVADTFDAMMTDRPYRKAFSLPQVKKEIRDCSGTQFDPVVVSALIDMLNVDEDEILARTGYTAYPTEQNV